MRNTLLGSLLASLSSKNLAGQRLSLWTQSPKSAMAGQPGAAPHPLERVVIALGCNIGDRVANINQALRLMSQGGIDIVRHACLYQSAPAYVTDQPYFLNSAVSAKTALPPMDLLRTLKDIERKLGRTEGGVRFGPRPLDLDIIFYGMQSIQTEVLEVPHPRMMERPFVVAPAVDLCSSIPNTRDTWAHHPDLKGGLLPLWERSGGEASIGGLELQRVMPLAGRLWDWSSRTHVMAVLNVTPDSFSDGGQFLRVEDAVAQAKAMAAEGADIIDIGGQSTRPGATHLSPQEEIDRVVPVIQALALEPEMKDTVISIDTFSSEVACAAVEAGAHIVNDVSGGTLDPHMLGVVATLDVPYVLMHMRGDPTTMQSKEHRQYDDVCCDVAREIGERARLAEAHGIPAWRLILDPGIGFAKGINENLSLLRDLRRFRETLAEESYALSHCPILVGPSRKAFLGKICGRPVAADRDWATAAAAVAAVSQGCNIVRAHNVHGVRDAVRTADAIWRHPKGPPTSKDS